MHSRNDFLFVHSTIIKSVKFVRGKIVKTAINNDKNNLIKMNCVLRK